MDLNTAIQSTAGPLVVCMVGLPRSGKTTWAGATGLPIVSPDAIRYAVHGARFNAAAEPWVWAVARAMTVALVRAGHRAVVFDATNTTRRRRDEVRGVADAAGAACLLKWVQTPAAACRARAEAERDAEILPVIDRMAGQFEPPGPDEPRID